MSDWATAVLMEVAEMQRQRLARAIAILERDIRLDRLERQLDEWQEQNEASMEASLLQPAPTQAEAAAIPGTPQSERQP